MKRLFILFLIANLASACLIIPLSSDHGELIHKAKKQIKVGQTTREEVISIIGRPNVSKERYIMYRNLEYGGGAAWVILSPSGPSPSGVVGQVFMDLYFEFDNYGVLVEFRSDKYDRFLKTVEGNSEASKGDENTPKTEEACDPGVESCP